MNDYGFWRLNMCSGSSSYASLSGSLMPVFTLRVRFIAPAAMLSMFSRESTLPSGRIPYT